MGRTQTCDILVVGAGPAGCSAALAARAKGLDVILCEKKPVVGLPVRCAEHIPALLRLETRIDSSSVVQAVKGMRTVLPDGTSFETAAPGYMIRRDLFDQALAEHCREQGAEIITAARAVEKDGRDVILAKKNGETLRIRPAVIIGADGPRSTVGRWMGSVNRDLVPALQARVRLLEPMDVTEVYFLKEIFGGYGWLFPRGSQANAGLGMRQSGSTRPIREVFRVFLAFLAETGKIEVRIKGYMAGWIPVRPCPVTVFENMILAGDAAGQTHPITGAGVPQAVVCGRMAGEWAAKAASEADTALLKGYEEEWKDLYGESLERGVQRREMMERHWDRFEEILPFCWVGFRDYYGRL
ncbi:MAG: NAD(P)/FAD-dependent oxidoreductase [Desulfatiglandales bacterium]